MYVFWDYSVALNNQLMCSSLGKDHHLWFLLCVFYSVPYNSLNKVEASWTYFCPVRHFQWCHPCSDQIQNYFERYWSLVNHWMNGCHVWCLAFLSLPVFLFNILWLLKGALPSNLSFKVNILSINTCTYTALKKTTTWKLWANG